MFWKRDWILIDKTILSSPWEQIVEGASGALSSNEKFIIDLPSTREIEFFRKTLILTFKCQLTGKIKVIKQSNE